MAAVYCTVLYCMNEMISGCSGHVYVISLASSDWFDSFLAAFVISFSLNVKSVRLRFKIDIVGKI